VFNCCSNVFLSAENQVDGLGLIVKPSKDYWLQEIKHGFWSLNHEP